jgi:putative membrane protein
MGNRLVLCALMLAAVPLSACNQSGTGTRKAGGGGSSATSTTSTPASETGGSGPGAAGATHSVGGSGLTGTELVPTSTPVNLSDAQILEIANISNSAEVAEARAALDTAEAPAVKSFASTMLTDHGAALSAGRTLAQKLEIAAQSSVQGAAMKAAADRASAELAKTSGPAFEKTYLTTCVALHQRFLESLDAELIPSTNAPQLSTFLSNLRATERRHLDLARSTLSEINESP